MPVTAYSPVEQGRLAGHPALEEVAKRHDATGLQVALAWLLRRPDVLAIPKAGTVAHVVENRAAAELTLSDLDVADLDAGVSAAYEESVAGDAVTMPALTPKTRQPRLLARPLPEPGPPDPCRRMPGAPPGAPACFDTALRAGSAGR